MSGLVALLAVIEVLAHKIDQSKMKRRIAFAALAGEPWGYMGSKQLLWQLHQGAESVEGLSLDTIDQVSTRHISRSPRPHDDCINSSCQELALSEKTHVLG